MKLPQFPATFRSSRQVLPGQAPTVRTWWQFPAPVPGLTLLLLLGLLGAAMSSHLDSRTAAYFAPWQRLPTDGLPSGLALADDDHDGDLDIWVSHEREKSLRRFRNDGSGRFVPAGRWSTRSDGMRVGLADFNEDGRPDVAVASYADSLLTLNLSQGPGRWDSARLLWHGARSFDAWAGDLDDDGHADLLAANRNDSAVVLFGDGRGGFPAHRRLAAGPQSLGVLAADVDRDGDRDLLLTSAAHGHTGHYVRLYRNQGHRRFARPTDFPVNDSPQRLAVADVDGDGDLDLLVTAYVTNQVDLCLNDGHGRFGIPRALPTGPQPFALVATDVNADGAPDLLTTSAATQSVSLLRNLGNGQFAQPLAFGVGTTPTGLAVGDLDGDGQPDLVTTDYADATITLLRHSRPPLVWWPLAGAALLGAGYAGLYYYQRRRQRLAQLRSQLAADLHDELGILLTRVTLRAELLAAQQPTPQLAALVQESRSAATAVRDIIWNVDSGTDTAEALLDRLRDLVETSRRATTQEILLHLAIDEPLLAARLRASVRQHTFLIAREALTNALRHGTRHGELHVALHLSATQLLLNVRNSGSPHPAGRGGQGLRSMATRAATIGALLQAGAQPDGSWLVDLRVPRPLRGWH